MTKIIITGGGRLNGTIPVSGSKNAVLPIIAASLLAEDQCCIKGVPFLSDVEIISRLIGELGAEVEWSDAQEITINAADIYSVEAPYECVRKMRASFLVMGPLLARLGRARIALPGGCAIGTRPIDLHLKGFRALGATIKQGHGTVEAEAKKLVGDKVYLDFPSVGATENIMMAATLAEGTTVIENAAEEPEIVELANYLNAMGARVRGAGTKVIKIEGVNSCRGATHNLIPDRIEAGTFMVAAAAAGEEVLVNNVICDHVKPVTAKLREVGVEIEEMDQAIRVRRVGPLKAVDVKTLPYPGFPTDMQPQMMALLTLTAGTSVITETVFDNRFMHVDELKRMGANIKIEGHSVAVVEGVTELSGAPVKATDLRAGAALIIAGLMANGQTEIGCIDHIERGYEDIVEKFRRLGASIKRI